MTGRQYAQQQQGQPGLYNISMNSVPVEWHADCADHGMAPMSCWPSNNCLASTAALSPLNPSH